LGTLKKSDLKGAFVSSALMTLRVIGAIASNHGKPTAVPTPRRRVRLEIRFTDMILFLLKRTI
jgi:hypothetical protein